jgi:hypothetical protein
MSAPTGDTLVEHARSLLEGNAYLTLGTVGAEGRPWTTPVYFAADGLTDFYWMSSTASLHSRHLADNPAASLVVFDSTVAPYHGRALYAAASAQLVEGDQLRRGLEVYPGPAARGGSLVTEEDVTDPSHWRLYRARATDVWVLCPREPRQPCPLHGRAEDHRARVHPASEV